MLDQTHAKNYARVAHHGSSELPMINHPNGYDGDIELHAHDEKGDAEQGHHSQPVNNWEKPQAVKHSQGPYQYLVASLKAVFLGSKLNLLMLLTPIALLSSSLNWNEGSTFLLSLLALAPFAERLGYVTEQLALYTNQTLGGLLNATFGNATELIVSIFALLKGRPDGSDNPQVYRRLVQVSLLGSVLSNLLLVLGSALLIGGRRYEIQRFTKIGVTTSASLLFLAGTAYCLPAVLFETQEIDDENTAVLQMSRFVSLMLLFAYAVFLVFQLVTHRKLYEEEEDDEEEEDAILGFYGSMIWLGILTVFISILSENMVDAIEGTVKRFNISELFIGAIIIPIVGNAAEHASAIMFAYKDKMDITLGVAVGSAVQIAVSALPLCVIIGWIIGCPLDLGFSIFEIASLLMTIILVTLTLQDGKTHWMIGVVLVVAYLVIAAGFWFHKSSLV